MGIHSETALTEANSLIEASRVQEAKKLLEDALTLDLENDDIVLAVRCCAFWKDALESQGAGYDFGERLVGRWKQFAAMLRRADGHCDKTVYAFTKCVFSRALEAYQEVEPPKDDDMAAELCRKKGLCYKRLGSYEEALDCLKDATRKARPSAQVFSEMADCYALCGEEPEAKVLFREAFFMDARKVDLDFLDSRLIRVVIDHVMSLGYTGAELQLWVPVYGVILHVLDRTRELRSAEVLRLKQEIFALENELKDPANDESLTKPRLMNLYIWLIDHYKASKDSVSKMSEVLMRMRVLDADVYAQYVK